MALMGCGRKHRGICCLFFFNDTATTEIYPLSLPDALPIYRELRRLQHVARLDERTAQLVPGQRSEEHTSELQSPCNLVCRLLLEKKKNIGSLSIHLRSYISNRM